MKHKRARRLKIEVSIAKCNLDCRFSQKHVIKVRFVMEHLSGVLAMVSSNTIVISRFPFLSIPFKAHRAGNGSSDRQERYSYVGRRNQGLMCCNCWILITSNHFVNIFSIQNQIKLRSPGPAGPKKNNNEYPDSVFHFCHLLANRTKLGHQKNKRCRFLWEKALRSYMGDT